MKRALFSLSLLILVAPSYATTTQTVYGGSGIGLLRTAELMEQGEWAISFSATGAEYSSSGSLSGVVDTVASPSISYGMSDWAEINLVMPYQYGNARYGRSGKGMLDPRLILKLGTGREAGDEYSAAITLFGSIATGDEAEGVVSGDYSSGVELQLSKWLDNSAIHLNLGFEQSDNVLGAGGPVRTDKYTVALGFDAALSERTTLFLQSRASSEVDTSDDNMLLTMGVHFTYNDSIALQAGYGQGFPRDRSEPESLLFANLSYAINGRNKPRYLASRDNGLFIALEQQNNRLGREVTELGSKVDELEDALVHHDKSLVLKLPLVSAPRTEVLNLSSNPQIVEHVMAKLRHAGVTLVGVRTPENLSDRRTWIYYREGFAREAVTLGQQIDGIQVVVKRQLPEGIDIQVLIGETLGKNGDPVIHR